MRKTNSEREFYVDENGKSEFELAHQQKFLMQAEMSGERDGKLNAGIGIRFQGNLDLKRLEQCIQKLFDDNDAFRFIFTQTEAGYAQRVIMKYDFELIIYDTLGKTSEERFQYAKGEAVKEISKAFDIFNDVLVQVLMYKIADDDYLMVININHLVSDGSTFGLVLQRLLQYYMDENFKMAEGTGGFLEFIKYEHELAESEKGVMQKQYWMEELKDFKQLVIKSSNDKSDVDSVTIGHFTMDKKALLMLATKEKTTIFNIIMLAYHITLSKLHSVEDTMVCFSAANRNEKKYLQTIGWLSRSVQNRLSVKEGDKLLDLLNITKVKTSENLKNQQTAHMNTSSQFYLAYQNQNQNRKMPPLNGLNIEICRIDVKRKIGFVTIDFAESETEVIANIFCDVEIYGVDYIKAFKNTFLEVIDVMVNDSDSTISDISLVE